MTDMAEPQINEHNKQEYPPMHTAEHILNRTMVEMFGCERSRNAHIERKKSKISYDLATCPSPEQVERVIARVNEVIAADLPVTCSYVDIRDAGDIVRLDRLPANVSETIRVVSVGDYDRCACAGAHVSHTAQIGRVVLLGTNWDGERKSFRIRFKLEGTEWEEAK